VIWAFKRRNFSFGKEITVDCGRNWTMDRVFRATGIVSTLKAACTMLCACNGVIWASTHRNNTSGKESTVKFRRNWTNGGVLGATALVVTTKLPCSEVRCVKWSQMRV
jgi:hypothetical protein